MRELHKRRNERNSSVQRFTQSTIEMNLIFDNCIVFEQCEENVQCNYFDQSIIGYLVAMANDILCPVCIEYTSRQIKHIQLPPKQRSLT